MSMKHGRWPCPVTRIVGFALDRFFAGMTGIDDSATGTDDIIYDRGLSYSVYGIWARDNDASGNSGTAGGFAAGTTTAPGNMPMTGTATYSGHAIGALANGAQSYVLYGGSAMTADFGKGQVTGSMALSATPDGGPTSGFWNTLTLNAAISGSGFAGTVTAPAVGGGVAPTPAMSGSTAGSFYGTQGPQEIGGIWNVSGGGASALGAFGGKQN